MKLRREQPERPEPLPTYVQEPGGQLYRLGPFGIVNCEMCGALALLRSVPEHDAWHRRLGDTPGETSRKL